MNAIWDEAQMRNYYVVVLVSQREEKGLHRARSKKKKKKKERAAQLSQVLQQNSNFLKQATKVKNLARKANSQRQGNRILQDQEKPMSQSKAQNNS